MKHNNFITQSELKEILDYNPETGQFTWVGLGPAGRVKNGSVAGNINNKNYVVIEIKSKAYIAHRLAWFYVYGEWPKDQIDHINGIRTDNRIKNLREATGFENQQNTKTKKSNTSGFTGVNWSSKKNCYISRIMTRRVRIFLGYFDTAEEAHNAYLKSKKELHSFNPIPRDAASGD